MNDDNVIPFPFGEIRNPLVDPAEPTEMDIASDIVEQAIIIFMEAGYDVKNNRKLVEDLGLILNLFYAIVARANGKEHFLHDALDDMSSVLREIKEELENDNH